MRAEDLKVKDIFSIDEKTGFPMWESNRILFIDKTGLSKLRTDLFRSMGDDYTHKIFYRYGYEMGIFMALVAKENYPLDSAEEFLRACGVLITMTGAAHIEFQNMQFNSAGRLIRCTGILQGSIEVYMSRPEPSSIPVCNILMGMMSGYASAIFGSNILFREMTCEGRGDIHCSFEGRPLGDWGDDVAALQTSPVPDNLEEEINRLRKALSDAWEGMKQQTSEIQNLKKIISVQEDTGIVYRSKAFARILNMAEKVASTRSTVLLQGESGTGKEVVARFIHNHSEFAAEPFLAINCAALPANLLESELFGHKKGAFTGAENDKKGLFIQAGKGTLFLDEIGEMSLELQAKLLRAIQQKEVRPVGGLQDLPVQARIVAATNKDLKAMVGEGRFREDLFFRLSVFPITVPPLRERREDVIPLIRHFLSHLRPSYPVISSQAIRIMEKYDWPGNVRELENWVEYAVILAGDERIMPEHLPLNVQRKDQDILLVLTEDLPTCKELEKRYIRQVLEHTGDNKSEAARILGMGISTLWRREKEDKQ